MRRWPFGAIILACALAACGTDASTSGERPGAIGASCLTDRGCDVGLTCQSDRCAVVSATGGEGGSVSGGAPSSGAVGGSSGVSGAGGPGGTPAGGTAVDAGSDSDSGAIFGPGGDAAVFGAFFTDTASCVEYLETLDPRGDDVDGDFIVDGDDDPSNDGLDDWGRPILDPETECGCTACLDHHLACQDNWGCREMAACVMNHGCRNMRECFFGDLGGVSGGWPTAGLGPCSEVIDKWGAQSLSAALIEEISRCAIQASCPDRKCPCAPGDASCPTREEQTCPFSF